MTETELSSSDASDTSALVPKSLRWYFSSNVYVAETDMLDGDNMWQVWRIKQAKSGQWNIADSDDGLLANFPSGEDWGPFESLDMAKQFCERHSRPPAAAGEEDVNAEVAEEAEEDEEDATSAFEWPDLGTGWLFVVPQGSVDPRTDEVTGRLTAFKMELLSLNATGADGDDPMVISLLDEDKQIVQVDARKFVGVYILYAKEWLPADQASQMAKDIIADDADAERGLLKEAEEAAGCRPQAGGAATAGVCDLQPAASSLQPSVAVFSPSSDSSATSALNISDLQPVEEMQPLPIPRPSDVSIDLIDAGDNPRDAGADEAGLLSLGDSLSQVSQIETVKLVRKPGGRFELVDGERRYRAAKLAGLASLRAEIYDGGLTPAQVLRIQLTTFATRKDMTHREWAQALADYARLRGGSITPAQIARENGVSDDHVRKHLAYAQCHEMVRQMVDGNRLSLNKAIVIGRLSQDQQEEMAQRCHLHGWSDRQLLTEVDQVLNPASLLPTEETAGHRLEAGGAESLPPASSLKPNACLCCGATDEHQPYGRVGFCDGGRLCTACGDEDAQGQSLSVLTRYGIDADVITLLEQANLETIGDLAELTTRRGGFWHNSVEGIGEGTAAKIADALIAFHRDRQRAIEAAEDEGKERLADGGDTAGDDGGDGEDDEKLPSMSDGRLPDAKGTSTTAQRQAQAKEDSDRAERERAAAEGNRPKVPATAARVGADVKAGFSGGHLCIHDGDTVCIEGGTLMVMIGTAAIGVRLTGPAALPLTAADARKLIEASDRLVKGKAAAGSAKKATAAEPEADSDDEDADADAEASEETQPETPTEKKAAKKKAAAKSAKKASTPTKPKAAKKAAKKK